jgi:type II secretory pathway pseudopilin PulG
MRRVPSRAAFTLTEMLIATALTLLIMVILTSAFQVGLDTFRKLKIAGDLQERLRAASISLRADLAAPHFGDPDNKESRGTRLSEYNVLDAVNWKASSQGFVKIVAPAASAIQEGNDGDGNPSSRANGHVLHMTCKRPGTTRGDVYLTAFPGVDGTRYFHPQFFTLGGGDTYASEWAEVAWFLAAYPTGDTTTGGLPRFRLCRQQRVLQEIGAANKAVPGGGVGYEGMSTNVAKTEFNTLVDVTDPTRRLQTYTPLTGTAEGDDVILPDVLSFEVKAAWDGTPAPAGLELPFDYLPAASGGTFDTVVTPPATTVPLPIRIKALQIRLRIWDVKSESTRQITLIQDM